jgi:hypothetical protein
VKNSSWISLSAFALCIASMSTTADARMIAGRGWRGGAIAGRGPNGSFVAGRGRFGGTFAAGYELTGNGGYVAGRSVQTASGRGYSIGRSGTCAGGTCSGSSTTKFNDGRQVDRSYTATKNADGSVSYDGTRDGPNGTKTVTGTFTPHS